MAVCKKSTSKKTSKLPSSHPTSAYQQRLQSAFLAWKQTDKTLSITKAAALYGVSKSTLHARIQGRQPRFSSDQVRQLLTPEEDDALKDCVLQLYAWGWPAKVAQLRQMAIELLRARGNHTALGVNWQQHFLHRHPDLQAKYSRTLDQERLFAENEEIFKHLSELFLSVKQKHGILDEDIYNMDEKGFMMGVAASAKVVIPKHEKQAFSAQSGNREWVSLIEAISATGRSLPLFVIFKGVNKLKAWFDVLEDIHSQIATSENGWTDNELGVDWLKRCFEPATAKYLHGDYRLLMVDGHASHISTEFIKFCNEKKIIPLYLPPHTTHLLQPLDVSVFGPLSREYKKQLEAVTRFNVCSIDKVDFLKIIQKQEKKQSTQKTCSLRGESPD